MSPRERSLRMPGSRQRVEVKGSMWHLSLGVLVLGCGLVTGNDKKVDGGSPTGGSLSPRRARERRVGGVAQWYGRSDELKGRIHTDRWGSPTTWQKQERRPLTVVNAPSPTRSLAWSASSVSSSKTALTWRTVLARLRDQGGARQVPRSHPARAPSVGFWGQYPPAWQRLGRLKDYPQENGPPRPAWHLAAQSADNRCRQRDNFLGLALGVSA